MTAKVKRKRKRAKKPIIAPQLRSHGELRSLRSPRYASRMISNAIGYFSSSRWDDDGLISKRRRMALRMLALEKVLSERGKGALSAGMMQQLEAFR